MLKVQEIRELIKLVDNSSISEFVYELDGGKIELKKAEVQTVVAQAAPVQPQAQPKVEEVVAVKEAKPAVAEAPAKEEVAADLHQITSPMVGTFYSSPSPEEPAYVKVGDKVGEEDVVCIVEAMKLFNEIAAEVTGEIVEVLAENGQLVEYGQPLFLVKAE
ncbi:MAG: acetyl-CoA carboxylase biotin carboxyl carrier protein [Bacillus sp. (in: firmicutes)]